MKLEKFKKHEIKNLITIKGGYDEQGDEEETDKGSDENGGSSWWSWILITI